MTPPAATVAAAQAPAAGVANAVRSAVKLLGSLVGTWGIAVVVRLLMPRVLGPEQFGMVNFADALTASVFVLLTFGADTYIRKEIAVRPQHANDFFGAMLLLRAGMTALLLGALAVAMALTDQPALVRTTVYLFAVGQFFFAANNSFAALLQARSTVTGLSLTNVLTKLLWGGGIGLSLWVGQGPVAIAAWFIGSEALRTVVLATLARRHLELRLVVRPKAAWVVLLASLPFFLSLISQTVCTRIGASVLGFFASAREVGFYGAGWTLAGMALLLAPLLNWVLLPFLAQAAARSEEDLLRNARRAIELVLAVAVPVALVLALGAEQWVTLLFGAEFAPAAPALRIMAPVFVLTYVGMVSSSCLILRNQAWKTTRVALGSLILNPLLHVLLVPLAAERFGPGGAGVGAALALLVAEAIAVGRLIAANRPGTFDSESFARAVRHAGICLCVVGLDMALSESGTVRLAVDALVYTVLVLATRTVPTGTLLALGRAVVMGRGRGRR